MADITDTQAIKFVNEQIRPLAEAMQALDYRIQACLTQWYASASALFPVDADAILQDGREAEGVSRLSGNDVVLLVTQLAAYKTAMDGAGVRNVISKPTVRALSVS
jgi:hypothetical protein